MGTRKKKPAGEPLRLEVRPDGVALVVIDVPGERQNTLNAQFNASFDNVMKQIETADDVRAIVICSGKPDSFVAGADITMLDSVYTREEATDLSRNGQAAFELLERSALPVVAAIQGACLGGGLELALACTARVAADDRKTKLGLPEVQLGLLPGAGGTQRLPRLVGIAAALDLMLTGRQLVATRARKLGLVDEVVPASIVVEAAAKRALALADGDERTRTARKQKGLSAERLQSLALEANPLGRRVLFDQARKAALKKSMGNYPAVERIIDVVEAGYRDGIAAGYDAESTAFGQLVISDESRQLRSIFFAQTALKSSNGVDNPRIKARDVRNIGVLGAGLMGAGIAYVSVDKADFDVRIKDRDDEGLQRGLQSVHKLFQGRVRRRAMSSKDAATAMLRVTGTTDYSGFEAADIVIEAVFEDLALKHRIVREIEAVAGEDTIFGTNTSSIPIHRIAEASARPHNLIGLHYFSPVDKMPLLEIIVTDQTSDEVTATCVKLGQRQGKTVIVVRDGVGFYTSRILSPYMNEAAYVLGEGVAIDAIDQALMQWGFPVGPITLLDEVGIDVASKVGPIMVDAFGARMQAPGTTDQLVAEGRLGRKAGKGFYLYEKSSKRKSKSKKKNVDPSVYKTLGIAPSTTMDPTALAERCGLLMVNEAVRCLEEGILRSPRDGDIGAIFGLGFPPFRGGPFRYVDAEGAGRVVAKLDRLADRHGIRFEAAAMLREMATSGEQFHKSG